MAHERESITSRQNPRIKELSRLKNRRDREESQRFLVEGLRELRHAVNHEIWIETLLICPALFKSPDHARLVTEAEEAEVEIVELGPDAFQKVSSREGPDGLIGVAVQRDFLLEGAALPENPFLLVIEKVEKPGNLGAMLRTADAAGVDCIICCDPVTDLYNPNIIRSSQGMVFALPIFVTRWETCRDFLKAHHVRTFATTPDAPQPIWEADLRGGVALFVGSEKDGLSPEILQAVDERVVIPMQGSADSLNVSVSAAISLYEAMRQRH